MRTLSIFILMGAKVTTHPVFTCSKLTVETLEQNMFKMKTPGRRRRRSDVFIVNFEQISYIDLAFPKLTLNK